MPSNIGKTSSPAGTPGKTEGSNKGPQSAGPKTSTPAGESSEELELEEGAEEQPEGEGGDEAGSEDSGAGSDDAAGQGEGEGAGDEGEGAQAKEGEAGEEEELEPEGEGEEGQGQEDEGDLELEDLNLEDGQRQQRSRSEAGRTAGWMNQLPPELKKLAIEDPRAFAEVVRDGRVRQAVSQGDLVEEAVEEFIGRYPQMGDKNKAFFKDFGQTLARAVESKNRKAIKDGSVAERRQAQVNQGMSRLTRLKAWRDIKVQREFWGEVRMLQSRGKWAPPEVIARRIGLKLDGPQGGVPTKPQVKRAGAGAGPRSVVMGDRSGSQGASVKPPVTPAGPKKKETTALEDWLANDVARAIDGRRPK